MKPADIAASVGRLEGEYLPPLTVPVKTACRLIGVSNSTMWKFISSGRVKTIKLGRKRLVIYSSLEALIEHAQAGPRLEEILQS